MGMVIDGRGCVLVDEIVGVVIHEGGRVSHEGFVCVSAGADQEHKTDEMHTALMEASMDGHVDVARLLLDHGAQV